MVCQFQGWALNKPGFLLAILGFSHSLEKNVLGLGCWSQEQSEDTCSTAESPQLSPV